MTGQPDYLSVECHTRDHARCSGYSEDSDLCECECHDIQAEAYLRDMQ